MPSRTFRRTTMEATKVEAVPPQTSAMAPAAAACASKPTPRKLPPLEAMTKVIDPFKCMGKWYVTHVIPNFIEKIPGIYNETEEYEWDEAQQRFKVTLSYAKGKPSAERSFLYQRGWIWNKETGAEWRVSPMVFGFALPIKLKYIIIDCADDYSHMTVGYPDRSFLWVMAREPNPPKEKVEAMLAVPESVGYDMSLVKPVPQEWPQ